MRKVLSCCLYCRCFNKQKVEVCEEYDEWFVNCLEGMVVDVNVMREE